MLHSVSFICDLQHACIPVTITFLAWWKRREVTLKSWIKLLFLHCIFLQDQRKRAGERARQDGGKERPREHATTPRAASVGTAYGERETSRAKERFNAGSPGRVFAVPLSYLWCHQSRLTFQLCRCFQDTLNDRDLLRAAEAQKQEAEEQQRKLYLSAKEKIKKLRKDREAELTRRVSN